MSVIIFWSLFHLNSLSSNIRWPDWDGEKGAVCYLGTTRIILASRLELWHHSPTAERDQDKECKHVRKIENIICTTCLFPHWNQHHNISLHCATRDMTEVQWTDKAWCLGKHCRHNLQKYIPTDREGWTRDRQSVCTELKFVATVATGGRRNFFIEPQGGRICAKARRAFVKKFGLERKFKP